MLDLASKLSRVPDIRRPAPWPGYEFVKGWAVFGLPFDSGHVLALRVMPESSIEPYRSLWHRDPEGNWSLYVHGARDCACTRYYGSVCSRTDYTRIDVEWTGPATVHVTMNKPAVDWTFTVSTNHLMDVVNVVNPALPWRPPFLVRAREFVALWLGLGRLELSGTAPSGNAERLMPERMYFIDEATASVDGVDLGCPTRLPANPKIGTMPLPARGILARGQASWREA